MRLESRRKKRRGQQRAQAHDAVEGVALQRAIDFFAILRDKARNAIGLANQMDGLRLDERRSARHSQRERKPRQGQPTEPGQGGGVAQGLHGANSRKIKHLAASLSAIWMAPKLTCNKKMPTSRPAPVHSPASAVSAVSISLPTLHASAALPLGSK